MKKILIVACTHGHEILGLKVQEQLKRDTFDTVEIDYIIGNQKAFEQSIPFVETDLNRSFPGKEDGTYEESRAFEISKILKNYNIVIDIHSTTTIKQASEKMIIVKSINDSTVDVIKRISPPVALYMKYKSENALISQARCGIAYEYGDNSDETAYDVYLSIKNLLTNLEKNSDADDSELPNGFYEVYDICEKNPDVKDWEILANNFEMVHKGDVIALSEHSKIKIIADEDFIPILFGNNRYKNYFGFKAKLLR